MDCVSVVVDSDGGEYGVDELDEPGNAEESVASDAVVEGGYSDVEGGPGSSVVDSVLVSDSGGGLGLLELEGPGNSEEPVAPVVLDGG